MCNLTGSNICNENMSCICSFMGNKQRKAIIHLYCAQSVSLCPGRDKRPVSEWWRKCRSSLPALTDMRPEKGQTPIKGWQGLGLQVESKAACVSKKKTQIKAWIWWRCVIWEEESCLSTTNKTCSNAVLGSLAYANGEGGGEEGFFCPDQNNLVVVDPVKVQLTVFLYSRTNFYYYWWTELTSQRWAHFNCVKRLVHSVLHNISTQTASVHFHELQKTIFTHRLHGSVAIFSHFTSSRGIIVIYSW